MKNLLKKNQVVVAVITLMLIAAGYLNYTSSKEFLTTSATINEDKNEIKNIASIGDAKLVSAVVTEESGLVDNDEDTNYDVDVNANVLENDYFSGSRIERDTMYSQIIDSYQKIIENDNSSQEQKEIAQNEITKINGQKNAIMIAENLVKTKGIEDLVVFVNNDNVNVIVKAEKLETEQIAQIQNIISRELNVEIENIHISNKK